MVCYNQEKYIGNAIDSILMQKGEAAREVVVLDDASTDRTFEIATEKLQGVAGAILVKNERNLGITKNYQKGFSLCRGEYVFVLEGDDYWINTAKTQRQIEFLEENPFCSMCFHPFLTQDDNKGTLTSNFKNANATVFDVFTAHDLIQNEGLIANYSVCCYRKSALDKLPKEIFDLTTYDWMVNITVGQYGFLGRINTVMSVYRVSNNGVWSAKSLEERLRQTERLIHDYDKALNYRYTNSFRLKLSLLEKQLRPAASAVSAKDFLPPVFISAAKLLVPPAFRKRLKK